MPFHNWQKKAAIFPIKTCLFCLSVSLWLLLYEYGVALKVWLPEKPTLLPPAFNPLHVDFQAYPLSKRTQSKKGGIPLSAFFHLKYRNGFSSRLQMNRKIIALNILHPHVTLLWMVMFNKMPSVIELHTLLSKSVWGLMLSNLTIDFILTCQLSLKMYIYKS